MSQWSPHSTAFLDLTGSRDSLRPPNAPLEDLASAHIGIAPLPDNPFTRGKCGLKILQYMAAGLPVVASPVGVNADLVRDGVSGYTANDVDQWVDAILRLVADPDLRTRMGEEGRRTCLAEYTLERVFEKLSATLSDIHG